MSTKKNFDIAIIGGGVVGITMGFWLSELYDCSIVVIDKEPGLAFHQSSRNTCAVHRPVLDDPRMKIGRIRERSYHLWHRLAETYRLPWITLGRLTLAVEEEDAFLLERGLKWGVENGIPENEISLLNREEIKRLEPYVDCVKGLLSTTESVTSYGDLTRRLFLLSEENGVQFARGAEVEQIRETGKGIEIEIRDVASGIASGINCSFLVNAGGGRALKLAHMLHTGMEYSEINLRGEYWTVGEPLAAGVTRNIYPVTRHGIEGIDLSFTGPHLITRYDGLGGWRKEIGPTGALVLGAFAYSGSCENMFTALEQIFSTPVKPWVKVLGNKEFYSFAWNQWRMTQSKTGIVRYLKRCIPSLDEGMLVSRGVTGVLYEVLGDKGFSWEPILLDSPSSVSILYVGLGATGAPVFSARTILDLIGKGHFDGLKKRDKGTHDYVWSFDIATDLDNVQSNRNSTYGLTSGGAK